MRLVIAGGGTGGHLYPGIAVADEVMGRPGGEILFVGTSRGIEARAVPAAGYALELLEVSGLKGMGILGFARGMARLPWAFAQSLRILRRFRPDVVLGVGGYASGPMVLAAALSGYPTAIQEQNSVPGVTNRILGRVARIVFVAFDEAGAAFGGARIEPCGNPIRRGFLDAVTGRALTRMDGADVPSAVLVVGGSQGARAVNDLVLGAAEILARQGQLPRLRHQTGAADVDRCREQYRAKGLLDKVDVSPFIDDMAAAYLAADLVVGRAGALTLAELAVVRRPVVLIPLPTAADDHQARNAHAFAKAGAAVVLHQGDTDAAKLAATLGALLADAPRLQAMGAAMGGLARPTAARQIVDGLQRLLDDTPAES